MTEACVNDPARECRSATKLALLEKRVGDLEAGQRKESEFREAYYEEQRRRIEHDARLDAKISGMDEKLDKVVEWQQAQQARPAKRWESLAEKALWSVCAAVIAFLLARVGL